LSEPFDPSDVPEGAEATGGGVEVRAYPMCEVLGCTREATVSVEVDAMRKLGDALEPLPQNARVRALWWALAAFTAVPKEVADRLLPYGRGELRCSTCAT
jgi:hypothetical protein